MFAPFQALKRALVLKVQTLQPAARSCWPARKLLHIAPHQADKATIQQNVFTKMLIAIT